MCGRVRDMCVCGWYVDDSLSWWHVDESFSSWHVLTSSRDLDGTLSSWYVDDRLNPRHLRWLIEFVTCVGEFARCRRHIELVMSGYYVEVETLSLWHVWASSRDLDGTLSSWYVDDRLNSRHVRRLIEFVTCVGEFAKCTRYIQFVMSGSYLELETCKMTHWVRDMWGRVREM